MPLEISNLIDQAENINEYTTLNEHSNAVNKELKKIEMYCRKTYLMLKHFDILLSDRYTEDEFINKLTAALIRDQKYVKIRDSLDEYSI